MVRVRGEVYRSARARKARDFQKAILQLKEIIPMCKVFFEAFSVILCQCQMRVGEDIIFNTRKNGESQTSVLHVVLILIP